MQYPAFILTFHSIFGGEWSFVRFSLNHVPHNVIKGVAIWREVRADEVTEIFSQLRLASPVYSNTAQVLLRNVGSSNSHPLVGLHVESETTSGEEWRHNVSNASD